MPIQTGCLQWTSNFQKSLRQIWKSTKYRWGTKDEGNSVKADSRKVFRRDYWCSYKGGSLGTIGRVCL